MSKINNDVQDVEVPMDVYGKRLDQVLVELMPDFSRSRLQQWIKQGRVLVNNEVLKARSKVKGGDQIKIHIELEEQGEWLAEAIPLDIIYEDQDILVVNKPAGLVVHPAAGNYTGTLLNALLYHCSDLITIPRAGIVHRLDKDTSGLLVVAKSLSAQTHLVKQLQARAFEREYEAIVVGEMTGGGSIDEPIGRHPVQRTKMAVVDRHRSSAKEAITHYRIKERYHGYTRVQIKLETGRTHQIRVHMAHIFHPLIGDPLYGGRLKLPTGNSQALKQFLHDFKRQALHARKLGLIHPGSGAWISWEADPPDDMLQLNQLLYNYTRSLL